MKQLFTLLITTSFFSALSFAQTHEVNAPLITCGAANGALAHSLSEGENHISAIVSFPTYVAHGGERLLNIPLDNSDTSSNSLPFLKEKNDLLTQVFSTAEDHVLSKNLRLRFNKERCVNINQDNHLIWYCENNDPQVIGGVNVSRVEFSIESQERVNINGSTQIFIGYLGIQIPRGPKGQPTMYGTSFTYYVGEDGVACKQHKEINPLLPPAPQSS